MGRLLSFPRRRRRLLLPRWKRKSLLLPRRRRRILLLPRRWLGQRRRRKLYRCEVFRGLRLNFASKVEGSEQRVQFAFFFGLEVSMANQISIVGGAADSIGDWGFNWGFNQIEFQTKIGGKFCMYQCRFQGPFSQYFINSTPLLGSLLFCLIL
jgi:hypothetical protein